MAAKRLRIKRIRQFVVRFTVAEEKTLRHLCRLAGCDRSTMIRDLIDAAARNMGLLAPMQPAQLESREVVQ